ncbi:MAG: DNA mismatch repair endonuclease MutL [Deltaproteobacteria bacterium]
MSDTIEILSSVVADQIAAGEVIERPASIVKELVENSLDAGAQKIEVEVQAGGTEGIVVRDDGAGMTRTDAERACLRHATSKLREIFELDGIASFGFRGEALASISAVSQTTIASRRPADAEGTRVRVVQGEVAEIVPAGLPPGTCIEVTDLFASVPARRKFLRKAATELSHISDWLQRAALAHPEVAFSLKNGAREVFRHPAVRHADERLRQVQGAARAAEMIACVGEEAGVRVRGWVSRAGTSYAQSKAILTFVGGRVVRDRLLTRAILDAYRALLPQGRYPAVVLFIDVAAGMVDVNVHPTKIEVRFADGDAIYSSVLHTLRRTLDDAIQAPAPSRPGKETGASDSDRRVRAALARYAERPSTRAEKVYRVRESAAPDTLAARAPAVGAGRAASAAAADRGASSRTGQEAMPFAEPAAAGSRPRFADLRIIGQALNGYIVCEGADGLVLIDQHAAHERVRFERLRLAATETIASQQLLVPAVVELDEGALVTLEAHGAELVRAGFEVEGFGAGRVMLRALPATLDVSTDAEVLLADLARDLAQAGAAGGDERIRAARDTLLARIACHGAVRVGDPLLPAEMQRLLADLDTIPFAATCPHGRPLMAELPRSEIERRVRR